MSHAVICNQKLSYQGRETLKKQGLVSAFQLMQTAAFPGTAQNVNSGQGPWFSVAVFYMLYFALQCLELGCGSEKVNCGCSLDKGWLSKMCPEVDNPRASIFIVHPWAFNYLKEIRKS